MSENKQVDLKKILSISGYSGLFMFISQAKSGIIVESLVDQKRLCISTNTKVSSMSDIAIYTDDKEIPLQEVFLKVKEVEEGKAAISSKSTPEELKSYMEKVLPDYDRERVYVSHIKKLVEWYNILQKNDMLDFVEEEATENAQEE